MDRAFLEYYEEELTHIRVLATEFAALHPAVARNLSLDTVPCPDPYVERLLEGVAFLSARTRLKLDAEGSRFARAVLDALYPDLIAPTPAVGMVTLQPGQQVQTMRAGHVVPRGTRLVAGLRPGLSTRATYSTAQDVTLWPIEIAGVAYHQDRSALAAASIGAISGATGQAALRVTLRRLGAPLSELALDRLDLHFRDRTRAPVVFDTLFGAAVAAAARPAGRGEPLVPVTGPAIIGLRDDEALMPRTRAGFEGYRLLREYFMMPERFHFARFEGLQPVVARAAGELELVVLLRRPAPELADIRPQDLQLFATPIVNLFERDCNIVEIDPRRPRQVIHVDRTRPRDFEIYRLTAVEDADRDGPQGWIPGLFQIGSRASPDGAVWWAERRPRRPGEDERRQGRMRTTYAGDDIFLTLSRPADRRPDAPPIARLAPRALCTNRDLPILDDQPMLGLESGDPVQAVTLQGALRPPRPALAAAPPGVAGENRADELPWRLVAQLSLNYLGLAMEGMAGEPLRATLELYADRGDPTLARHVRGIAGISARPVVERLPIAGPMCFGRGTEVTLEVDETQFAGQSALLLPMLLARLFARYAAVNAFVRTRTRLLRSHEEVQWPITVGNRSLI